MKTMLDKVSWRTMFVLLGFLVLIRLLLELD